MTLLADKHIWLIGCGNMGRAMLNGWLAHGVTPTQLTVIDPALPSDLPQGVRALAATPSGTDAAPDILLLAVKPQSLADVAPSLAPHVQSKTLLLSILAGIEVSTLRRCFPNAGEIVRVMPNMPAAIGKGISALYTPSQATATRETATRLLSALGAVEWIAEEALFDAVTAVSGCGPAFVFRFIAALAQAGAALGLPSEQSLRLAQATVEGAALLASQSSESVGVLADRVASPGGSTRAGLNVLDEGGALHQLMAQTVKASALRNQELAKLLG